MPLYEPVGVGRDLSFGVDDKKTFKVESVEKLGAHGVHETKQKVGLISEDQKHKLKVVTREAWVRTSDDFFGNEKEDMDEAQRYYERWKFLKMIGIPVASSMRAIDARNILMGDMTRDGSQFIGQGVYQDLIEGRRYQTGLTDIEQKFLEINPDDLKGEIERIQKLAYDNDIRLPYDDEQFSVLVHPGGTWQVLVLDLECLTRESSNDRHNVPLEVERDHLFSRVDLLREGLLSLNKVVITD